MDASDLALVPAVELSTLIADGFVSAREALDACVGRYERLDHGLNAVVAERIEAAHADAAAADEAHARGHTLGGLHGVPVTIKEAFDLAGSPTTWGEPELAGNIAATTAAAPQALIDAGAIVWGKTNVPKMLGDWQTFNKVYGTTSNPWDRSRTPGGSSGGSAAAIAAGYSALELGSDIGGSIRFPAHYCGVFGHKPTFGLVSQRGHEVPGHPAPVDIVVCGPLARSADDLALAMRLLSEARLLEPGPLPLQSARIGVLLDNPLGGEQDAAMTAVLRAAIDALQSAGAQIIEGFDAGFDHGRAYEVYRLLNHAATSHCESRLDEEASAARYAGGDRSYAARFGMGSTMTHREWLALNDEREGFRRAWGDIFEQVDVVVCPVSASPAPHHDPHDGFGPMSIEVNGRAVSILDQWFWAAIASGVDLPATVAPIGFTTHGLPVGMQVLAAHRHDLRAISFAGQISQLVDGYRAPAL